MMSALNDLDKNSLLLQAMNYETFLELNSQILEKDRLLKEQVALRMGMLQSTLAELDMFERTDHQTEYEQSLDRANRIQQGVKVLIEYMLRPNNPPAGSFQSIA